MSKSSVYYHVVVETSEKNKKDRYQRCYELDKTSLAEIIDDIVRPYVDDDRIYIDGRFIAHNNIRMLKVMSSDRPLDELCDIAQRTVSPNVFFVYTKQLVVESEKYVTDITKETMKKARETSRESPATRAQKTSDLDNGAVFIVHGRDDYAEVEVARFVEKLGFSAIILHEQANSGKTLIEKIEQHTNVGFAIVLYTPCDKGALASGETLNPRARQNVIFEHGLLIGKLGRERVCALVKNNVELPTDISGVVYIPMDQGGAWHLNIAKELRAAGYQFDPSKVLD